MSTFARWWRFNVVGALGMVVQLGTLAVLNRWAPGHDLCSSVIALEITLLHNFAWHLQFTWRERRGDAPLRTQLVRFHLSNGLVSLLGNLVLMAVLVRAVHLPVVLANGVAILSCSALNFALGNLWAFGKAGTASA